ncbi:glutathione synthase [Methylococcaceae bacterium CS1]|uniref:glutathione synthase n=1 Tax=Bathymodiolus platifrons methanotrophic gill symbiont TaxID=113268 RepID=UPI000B412AE4|nr:glutathione synthase [Bathymodiolus platifrons methanotrophic gill symbiont]MCK5870251.1 glutathione synthase [Methyloprofundus sp.]TXK94022.1 glutathione synthase [Methylococcaceae bacterium CS4]TXK98546.1 glutathione synthase [Methylococcaceae bacterium CS5]TXL05588.1 glutathione synthase [Methylococcaceae bacterium CS1]TXL09592.1 glutathione synthase [Methylococcaceae bacterium CS3]TXL10752.1 glutathione synthase [Methylococcaceae bacterium CS2]
MTIKLGMVMDSIDHINIQKDTSFAMLLEAQARNWEIYYLELGDLFLRNGKAYAYTRQIQVERNPEAWYKVIDQQSISLESLDCIIMRKEPPVDQEYIYATHILEQAEKQGVYVINKPQSLRDANEKLYTAWFPECCTDTLVTRRADLIREFLKEHKDIILKPLDGMGGASIFHLRCNDPNISVIIETITENGTRHVMGQRYLSEIKQGDKRILIVNGEAIPYALARIPAKGETRGNLAAGGFAQGQALSERDIWIAQQVGPVLKEKGLVFVGIDVIGDYLTEINVTSPTCVQELDKQFGINICAQLMDHIETMVDKV